ncbi:HNH endonuclease domain-containing protein [Methanoplanus limicola]|uniref:HNH endonuclease domain-containing protein n=1 Tax=Methanoplanus limicola TaxID=2315 RepID=UPI000650049B|nr:HNH endonuclease domain-containing protein [Methanoplanus limicola]
MSVDHMIPFSVWKNNDLWNLLPALNSVNSKKSDKIPSPALIEKRSDAITGYWDILHEKYRSGLKRKSQYLL